MSIYQCETTLNYIDSISFLIICSKHDLLRSNTDYHIRIVHDTINLIDLIVFQIIKRQLIKFDIDFCIEIFTIEKFHDIPDNDFTFNSSLLTE